MASSVGYNVEVSQNLVYLFGSHNKDHNIWGSILGSLHIGKLPFSGKLKGCWMFASGKLKRRLRRRVSLQSILGTSRKAGTPFGGGPHNEA